jgi:hypothetical protein
MGSDLLRRVRWRNVGRTAGAVAVVVVVVAWPRLSQPAPRLPDPVDRPLAAPEVAPPPLTSRRRREVARPRVRGPERRRRAPRRRRHEPRRDAADDAVVAPDAAVVAPRDDAVPPREEVAPPPRAAPSPDAAQREFGFERQ